jgi:hypothetical protein
MGTVGHGPSTGADWLVLRNEVAWLLHAAVVVRPVVVADEGARATGKVAPGAPRPFRLRLQAAAAEAPATRPASMAARTGDLYIAGAQRPMTSSGAGPIAGTWGDARPARSSKAHSSWLESPGVAAERRDLSNLRSASAAARQPGQIETCWSHASSAAAARLRSAYGLSFSPRCCDASAARGRTTGRLTGSPSLPVPTRSHDGPASARASGWDRGPGAREPHATANDPGESASGPCRA